MFAVFKFLVIFFYLFYLTSEQAPASMKSVVTAAWLFTTALGNFLVVVITSLVHFDSAVLFDILTDNLESKLKLLSHQANQFLFYGTLMFFDILLFIALAYFYKPRTPRNIAEDKEVLELRNSGESLDNNDLSK